MLRVKDIDVLKDSSSPSYLAVLVRIALVLMALQPIQPLGAEGGAHRHWLFGGAPQGPLFDAVRDGDLGKVQTLIADNTDVNARVEGGCPALKAAIATGHTELARLLLDQGATLDWEARFMPGAVGRVTNQCRARGAETPAGKFLTPLHIAVRLGDVEMARLLTGRGMDLEERDPYGFTPLWIAVSQGNAPMVDLLIEQGADVGSRLVLSGRDLWEDLQPKRTTPEEQQKYLSGMSYLHKAASTDRSELVERFLAAGLDVNARTRQGRTPLHFANGVKVTRLLLAKGAEVDAKDLDGLTAMAIAVQGQDLSVAEVLVRHGAATGGRLLITEAEGPLPGRSSRSRGRLALPSYYAKWRDRYPLHHAAERGDLAAVGRLIEAGSDIQAGIEETGDTPLHAAARGGHPDIVALLLERGARPDPRDRHERTPLHVAAGGIWLDHLEVVRRLAAAGADVNAFNWRGIGPLHLASELGHLAMMRALISRGANVDGSDRLKLDLKPLHQAADAGQTQAVALLLERGADANAVSETGHGDTPLQKAVIRGYIATAKLLLERGARADVVAGTFNCTALHDAAFFGQAAMVDLLLDGGADLEARCEFGTTPLLQASRRGNVQVAAKLIAKGADVNARDKTGHSVLDQASGQPMIQLLTHHGARSGKDLGPMPVEQAIAPQADPDVCPPGIFEAARTGAISSLDKDLGCDPSTRDAAGTTPLHDELGLRAYGLDTTYELNYSFSREATALHMASRLGRLKLAKLLLDHRADPNAQLLSLGMRPLHEAVSAGQREAADGPSDSLSPPTNLTTDWVMGTLRKTPG